MHKRLRRILKTERIGEIENRLAAAGIKTETEKTEDGSWIFRCTGDAGQTEKAGRILEKEGAECTAGGGGIEGVLELPEPVFSTYSPEDGKEKIEKAKNCVKDIPNAVCEETDDGLLIAVLPYFVPYKAGNIARYRKYQHRTAETLAAGYDLSDIFRYMLIDSPTSSGKSAILALLYLVLKEKDPELKMIVSTTQHSLAGNILDSFRSMEDVRAAAFKGIEKLAGEFFDNTDKGLETRYQGVEQEGLDLLDSMYRIMAVKSLGDFKKDKVLERELQDKRAEYTYLIRDIRDRWALICARWGAAGKDACLNDAEKEEREEKAGALARSYKRAEKILNDACWKASEKEAEDRCRSLAAKEDLSEKNELDAARKDISCELYKEKMQLIDDRYKTLLLLFPDMQYELCDVIVVTHAKSVRSILNKRSMNLARDISRDGEGGHIVFVCDEMEQWREEYETSSIREAVKNSVDMLSSVNTIHSITEKNYFSNKNYEITNKNGERENKAEKNAERLKDLMDEVFETFNYEPNMHMADFPNEGEDPLPRITSCGAYIIQNVQKDLDIRTDPETMEVAVSRPEVLPGKKGKGNTGFVVFVQSMDRIIQFFIGTVREAAAGLNQFHNTGIQHEDFEATVGTVLHQLGIESGTGGRAEFIRRNMFPRHGVHWVSQDTPHPYRIGISHTVLHPRLPSGRDVYLYFFKLDRFADAAMADIIYNVRFTYLMSGTGWLAAQNNLNDRFLDKETGRFLPDRAVTGQIHEDYMAWKGAQYRNTEFIIDRISGEEKFNDYRKARLETCALFITRHIGRMEEKGVDGGTGGLIFPSWSLTAGDIEFLRARLRWYGTDPDRVILLSLEKGKINEWHTDNGNPEQRPYAGAETVDDTQVVKTVSGRFTYVATAYRSGSRGYNIAFSKEGEDRLYDASGIWLTAFTNIIPGIEDMEGGGRLETGLDFRKKMARALEINAKYVHTMILREGTISRQGMAAAEKRIKDVLSGQPVPKDIYKEDVWSPYKLQGTSEILQALGRLRNNKKEPAVYIALDSIIFEKMFLREEHLDPDRLSYEADQVCARLPELWRGYEEESQEGTFVDLNNEKKIYENSRKLIRIEIPKYKKQLADGHSAAEQAEALQSLKWRVHDYEFVKKRAMYMNTAVLTYPRWEYGEKSRDLGIPSIWLSRLGKKDIPPFAYYSRRTEKGTEFSLARIPGQAYLAPSTGDIVPVIRMFSHFCRDSLKERMPELMNPETLRVMEQKDMFPYPVFAGRYGYDLFIGEFGELIFDAVMDHARKEGMTELTVRPMPISQYEDYDREVCSGSSLRGYINVKYRLDADFETEKDPKYYIQKAMRSPMKGEILLLYIDIRPFGDTEADKVFTGSEGEGIFAGCIRDANRKLKKEGKSITVIAMKPLTAKDMYAPSGRIKEAVIEKIVQRLNKYFGG